MFVRLFSLTVLSLFVSSAYAVSYNCQKAKTFVEKSICQDQELSTLDDELSSAYQQAEDSSKNPKDLKKQQLKWLKERDACQTVGCVKKSYQKRIIDLTPNE
jgi:uncharacterized protein